jgi:hypothetical protein
LNDRLQKLAGAQPDSVGMLLLSRQFAFDGLALL